MAKDLRRPYSPWTHLQQEPHLEPEAFSSLLISIQEDQVIVARKLRINPSLPAITFVQSGVLYNISRPPVFHSDFSKESDSCHVGKFRSNLRLGEEVT